MGMGGREGVVGSSSSRWGCVCVLDGGFCNGLEEDIESG